MAFPNRIPSRRPFLAPLLPLVLLALAFPARAQSQPQLTALFPLGGKAGTSVEIRLTACTELDSIDRLVFSHPGITAVPRRLEPAVDWPLARTAPGVFTVTIAPDVPAGIFDVRAAGRLGVSNARSFQVGHETDLPAAPAGTGAGKPAGKAAGPAELPVGAAVSAVAGERRVDQYRFQAGKGRRVLVECFAERLDSRMEPVLAVLDPGGREAGRARDTLGRDAHLILDITEDGPHTVKVHDAVYRGGPDFGYRLRITDQPVVLHVFPPAATPGAAQAFTLLGCNLPGSRRTPSGLEALDVTLAVPPAAQAGAPRDAGPRRSARRIAALTVDQAVLTWSAPGQPPARLVVPAASAPVVVEREPDDPAAAPQRVSPPCEVAGRFDRPGDSDVCEFAALKGQAWVIEVLSQRMGLSSDPAILVRRVAPDGGPEKPADAVDSDDMPPVLKAEGLDSASGDVAHVLAVPADGVYRVTVRDLNGSAAGGPARMYRLSIRPPAPDFRLFASSRPPAPADKEKKEAGASSLTLVPGGWESVDVHAWRRDGFDGPIEVGLASPPPGVRFLPATIAPGAFQARLLVRTDEGAAPWSGPLAVVGKGTVGGAAAVRVAGGGETVWAAVKDQSAGSSRLVADLFVAVSPFLKPPVSAKLAAATPPAPAAPVTPAPAAPVTPAPASTAPAPPAPALPAPAAPAPVTVTAPGTGADGTLTIDTVELAKGATLKLAATLQRLDGFKGEVALRLEGVPKGLKAGAATVKPDQAQATLDLAADAKADAGEFTLALVAETKVRAGGDPEALARLRASKAALAKVVEDLNAAKPADLKARLDGAEKARKQIDERLAAVEKAEAKEAKFNEVVAVIRVRVK